MRVSPEGPALLMGQRKAAIPGSQQMCPCPAWAGRAVLPQPIPCSTPIVPALSAIANQHRVLLITSTPEPSLQPRAGNEPGEGHPNPGVGCLWEREEAEPIKH